MYVPAHFEETRWEVLSRLIHDHSLAALGPSDVDVTTEPSLASRMRVHSFAVAS